MKIFSEDKKQLFAIFRQGYHIGNQSGISMKSAIENYIISSGYSKDDLIELGLVKNYLAIKAVADVHYAVSKHIKLSLDDMLYRDNELKQISTMEKKYNILVDILKQKKENYADLYNELILEEIKSYTNNVIPCLNNLINSFEIKEWLISLKCQLLYEKDNFEPIIKDSISYGTKPIIY